jgi:hypothetical protein
LGPLDEAFQRVYAAEAPELVKHEEPWHERIDRDVEEIRATGFFSQVQVRTFLWTARYDAAQYTGLLNTYSDHLALPISRRERLFAEVQRVIAEHGGYLDRPYHTLLFVATTKNAG